MRPLLVIFTMILPINLLSQEVYFDKDSAIATGLDVVMLMSSRDCNCTKNVAIPVIQSRTHSYAIWHNWSHHNDPLCSPVKGLNYDLPFMVIFNSSDTVQLLMPNTVTSWCITKSKMEAFFSQWESEYSTGISSIEKDVQVFSYNKWIYIRSHFTNTVYIYNLAGSLVYSFSCSDGNISLPAGFYFVKVNSKVFKVSVW